MSTTIVLVGPMGAGKSSVGRRLAALRGCDFADTDAEIERRTGVDIAYIFEKEGEGGFRQREQQALADLLQRSDTVLATGGGIVKRRENRRLLMRHNPVVFLHATVDQQYDRVRHARHRPLLDAPDPKQVLQSLFDERERWYRAVANFAVDTDGAKVEQVARDIAQRLAAE